MSGWEFVLINVVFPFIVGFTATLIFIRLSTRNRR